MKLHINDVLKSFTLSLVPLIALYGLSFGQQPVPTATPTPASDVPPNTRVAVGERGVSYEVSILLERIERLERKLNEFAGLERRLNELESRLGSTTSNTAGSAVGAARAPSTSQQSANVAPQNTAAEAPAKPQLEPAYVAPQNDVAAQMNPTPSTSGAMLGQAAQKAQNNHAPALPSPYAAWDKDGVKIIPFGILIANINYNTSSLDSGSIVAFANPNVPTNRPEFDISPGNTFLGADIKWPKIGKWEINGKIDFDLRGPTPLRANNLFAPLFIHAYGEAKTERYRIMAGQAEDLVSPLISNSLNTYPFSFLPGKLGFYRPQARFETYQPIGGDFTFIFKGAIAQSIQTFQVGSEVIGDQTGLPDGQMRFALGYGKPDLNDPNQRRPFELGVFGHLGQRRGTQLGAPVTTQDFTSWSLDVDLSFKIGRKLRIDLEYFRGSVLGDYAGGIFQTFNPIRLVSIRAAGGWGQLSYDISDKWQVNAAYGRDDPYNRDLAFGQRSLNYSGFGNIYYKITPRLWVAAEFSRWTTTWVGLPTGRAFRIEPAVMFFF